ncbi:hypothetical protein GDO86_017728 [Hymenochirus boettgeri]|uniref:Olfactory receptor n=1 Tax=Hymenochirus boettgeri TaxID=247094 RepID=A0A8T2IL05_9PIPI|nr:hypothetical protein GDO86_017728 [Hymenochirus boettgeri]
MFLNEILLLGFQRLGNYRFVFSPTLIFVYTFILSGNTIIILVILSNKLLQSPMYFFLCNLSFSEIICTTIIFPIMLQSLLRNGITLSLIGCLTQFFFFASLVLTESFLLTVMSYDRYLAICRPLHYSSIMNFRFCCYLSLACWTSSFLMMSFVIGILTQQDFCGQRNTIDHFFCDLVPILDLSCSDTSDVKFTVYLFSPLSVFCPFLFITMTYISIIRSVLSIRSATGKKKAFSTCTSHVIVVSTYYITLFMVYLVPTNSFLQINKVLSLLYTVITPLVNPFIYSLSNREIKAGIAMYLNWKIKMRP